MHIHTCIYIVCSMYQFQFHMHSIYYNYITFSFIIAVLNSVGAKVTITSTLPLAGTMPVEESNLVSEC